jgi:hypothetical protein
MIRLRSIFGDDIRIKRTLDYYDAGNGPIIFADKISGSGPVPANAIYDRSNALVLDRFSATIETRV